MSRFRQKITSKGGTSRNRCGIDQVPAQEPDRRPDRRVELVARRMRSEVARAVIGVHGPEGVLAVDPPHGPVERAPAHVNRVDRPAPGGQAQLPQGDRERVGLFTPGAGDAQNAKRPPLRRRQPARSNVLAEASERGVVAEEPALGNDHLLDQRVLLDARFTKEVNIIGLVPELELRHPGVQSALEQAAAHRGGVEPDPLGQDPAFDLVPSGPSSRRRASATRSDSGQDAGDVQTLDEPGVHAHDRAEVRGPFQPHRRGTTCRRRRPSGRR